MHPKNGLTRGGTKVEVVGMDFRYMPQYGVVPHCRFGDKIVRATFESTVRLVCPSPPSEAKMGISFEVSLNGVDWTDSKLTYSYYEEPVINSVFPDAGPASGGTEVPRTSSKSSSRAPISPTSKTKTTSTAASRLSMCRCHRSTALASGLTAQASTVPHLVAGLRETRCVCR